jgi:hypothetical protein
VKSGISNGLRVDRSEFLGRRTRQRLPIRSRETGLVKIALALQRQNRKGTAVDIGPTSAIAAPSSTATAP